jgi:ketosteroid isomerase-like protein
LDVTITPAQGSPSHRSGYTLTIFRKQANGSWLLARDANLLGPA